MGLFSEEDIAATAKSGKPTSVAFFRIESSENRKIIDLDITSLPVEKSQNSAKSKGFSAVCHLRFRQFKAKKAHLCLSKIEDFVCWQQLSCL
ncbi:TPA: hypothetical protein I7108_000430 [Vibrio cholerae O1]|uniref:Uncharacterized protein n=5 Tax=Vibrio cholerae TaxID=666 RepID=A0A655QG35_VIBCL|nr:hypothetical protein EEL44_02645 [Vibrio cholerae]EGR00699.1 hypothetical protein VCHCUF01_1823 [Vibrio cholerae HCUF01]EGR05892.1 hypothetical protein VCHC49A2_1103 [Vibrio cholerae HC-49A2]EHH79799.1 hypothetical protein VCHC06A1_3145 [Vibrio cholerae HC-06A1]EHH84065.1 hypothetical protein VCHC23A1_1829 [Vibrio cholerae HC-23A1]EHH93372.1 hypothetical protein VCHC33A2_3634 [Vibrio cholerae HC-33A2]EHH98810.1 hypothetical protein VCHC43A1_1805 [Vibrio cholerae HC-43A1]EHI10244.1 hypothe